MRHVFDTAAIRAVYRSPQYPNLVVVDKENGGKADSWNAGLNVARYRYVCGVDADTVFDRQALLKVMRAADPGPGPDTRRHEPDHHRAGAGAARSRRSQGGASSNVDRSPCISISTSCVPSSTTGSPGRSSASCSVRRAASRSGGGTCSRRSAATRPPSRARTSSSRSAYTRSSCAKAATTTIYCLPDSIGVTESPDTVSKLVAQRERWQRVIDETVVHYRRMWFNRATSRSGSSGRPCTS